MREILFRGKRICNDVMMFGSLFCDDGDCYIVADDFHHSHYKVLPETVGQYTGLKDKNGKRIFEGDICLCDRNINDTFDKTVFEIKYDTVRGFYGENFSEIDAWEFCMCEIVGNIHDNQEMLGGGGDG